MAKLKHILNLFAISVRLDLNWLTQDTAFCLITVLSETIVALSSVIGIFLLALRFGGIGSLSADEILFMLGFYTLASGTMSLFFGGENVLHISRRIGRGQLDHMIIQPVSLPLQMITSGFLPITGNSSFVCGLVIVIVACFRLSIAVTAGWVLLFLLFLLCAAAIVIAYSYCFASFAFYYPYGSEEISGFAIDGLLTLGSYPLGDLSVFLKGFLFSAFPSGCIAYLPALVLLGKTDALLPALWVLLLAAFLSALATTLFKKGLKHYETYGSQRYKPFGMR